MNERPGQAGDIGDPENHTLASLLCARASERPGHPFVSFPDRDVSYREMYDSAEALARGLLGTGLRPGGHVGILMMNCVAYLELFFAIHLAGGVAVLLTDFGMTEGAGMITAPPGMPPARTG